MQMVSVIRNRVMTCNANAMGWDVYADRGAAKGGGMGSNLTLRPS